MKQKNGLWATALLFAGVLTSSCSDDNQYGGSTAEPGSPILFSVASGGSDTRTIYESNLQINWLEKDSIGICSPSDNVLPTGTETDKNAVYQVQNVNADGHPHHATIIPANTNDYLQWGADLETPAIFYGAYPADRIESYPTGEDGLFKMKYITNQVCTVISSENGKYLTKPDMKNAYMIAKNELKPKGDHVLLSFDPIMTTPDITITAGSYEVGTGIIQPVTVTGVSILMPKALTGKTLNYKINGVTNEAIDKENPRGELQNYTTNEEWESVFVQIDNDGKKYIDLYEGESINLMAFLPPIPNLTGAKIRVHTLGATDFVRTVKDPLLAQSKIKIQLPDVTPETTKPNNWISQLDGSTLLKEMSIPAYVCKEGDTPEDIEDLFKKGVRAFDANVFTSTSGIGLSKKKTIDSNFIDKINNLFKDEKNQGEFVIVWVDNDGKLNIPTNWSSFHDKIADARKKVIILEKHYKNLLAWASDKFTNAGGTNELFLHLTIEDSKKFKIDNSKWTAQLITDANYNQSIYNTIISSTEQTGCTGIVTIPNAGQSFDSSYGDLLLQAVIDCNFKLRRNSKNQQ